MQLLIILALLLYAGKSGAQNLISEVKPVLESIGGDEMKEAIKSAEEISSVLEAVKGFTETEQSGVVVQNEVGRNFAHSSDSERDTGETFFPLAPIANVADRSITYSLSRYITNC